MASALKDLPYKNLCLMLLNLKIVNNKFRSDVCDKIYDKMNDKNFDEHDDLIRTAFRML
jgi:hypothetical protein